MESAVEHRAELEDMSLPEWRAEIADPSRWLYKFGPSESPVEVVALEAEMSAALEAVDQVLDGQGVRLFVVGPPGAGKSAVLSAVLAEASRRGHDVASVSAGSDPQLLGALGRGRISLLTVNRLDVLSQSARDGILANRDRCSIGMAATAETLSAVARATLAEPLDVVINIPVLEQRPRDILAIAEWLWRQLCGDPSASLVSLSDDEALENLCQGPYPGGVSSLRDSLRYLADALVTTGDLLDGELRRSIEARDVSEALLAVLRERPTTGWGAVTPAVIVVEGSTDVTYLEVAATRAADAWGWDLLDGCELRAAGEDRRGGAEGVWRRLFELTANSVECIGLFDNDDVGRRENTMARRNNLRAELLPREFDRLKLPEEHRSLEIEDLLCVPLLDRFYEEHANLEPEERRERVGGLRRITPQGVDKERLAAWVSEVATIHECERLVYVLCRLRKALGLGIPRDGLDEWLGELIDADC